MEIRSITLEEMDRLMSATSDAPKRQSGILPEAKVMRLREAALRYAAPNPFKVGDLVTPRADAILKGAGEPHIVIEVRPHEDPYYIEPEDVPHKLPTVRLLRIAQDSIFPLLAQHADLEPYTGPGA